MVNCVRSGFLLLLTLGLFLPLGYAGIVSGEVSGIWSLENSPYVADSDITVPAGMQLEIEPGVAVQFSSGAALYVNGELQANGTPASPIIFCGNVINLDTAIWNGILFNSNTGRSLISNAVISTAANPITAETSILEIRNSNISGYCTGISSDASMLDIDYSTINVITSTVNPNSTPTSIGIYSTYTKLMLQGDTINVAAEQFNHDAYGVMTEGGSCGLDSSVMSVYATRYAYGITASGIDTAYFLRNIIRMNSPVQNTGLVFTDMGVQAYVYQNTIRYLANTQVIAVQTQRNRGMHFRNNIFWGASPLEGTSHGLEGRSNNLIDWDYNLLCGFNVYYLNAPSGNHDLLTDPMLSSNEFRPVSGSPVINTGDPTLPWDPDGTLPDIGAVPFRATSVGGEGHGLLPKTLALQTYPNPFNSTIRIAVPAVGKVNWRVFDRLGRIVSTGNGIASNGTYMTSWHPAATVVSGWYTLEVATNKGVARRTLCYLR